MPSPHQSCLCTAHDTSKCSNGSAGSGSVLCGDGHHLSPPPTSPSLLFALLFSPFSPALLRLSRPLFRAAILAARLNGSEVVGSTGDINATGRICLAVFEFDGEFNVFYHALVSTSEPGAPTSAFVALGTAGKAGPIVLKIAGAKAKWTNKTRLPPPFLSIDKTNNPPPPMYTYAFKGTWLNASRIPNASIGKSVKSVVNLLKSKTNSYYGGFSTGSFTAGAARGQFKSEPLPLVGVMEARLRAFPLHEVMEPDYKAKGCVSLAVFRLHSLLPSPYPP
ncbi:unnamed protein product [Closterium sp. Naga37s-1]|nr:unnamed protein product [Closterium sp. Naga37s-1]CAI5517820.1 unnamed protein product [Closterium sp. Naga37s-1]